MGYNIPADHHGPLPTPVETKKPTPVTVAEAVDEGARYSITAGAYAAFCGTTAFYPQHVAAEYLALGMTSEAGEVAGAILSQTSTPNDLAYEIGDCQWYAARLCDTYGFDFAALVERAGNRVANDERRFILNQTIIALCASSGEIAGVIKKQLRDGATWTGEQREEKRQKVEEHLVRMIEASMQLLRCMNSLFKTEYSYHRILTMNRDKLQGRKDRNVLGGDGDKR